MHSVEKAQADPTAFEKFFPFILIALFFYFILIRPAQRKQQAQNQFLQQLKLGDEVLTSGGIYGRIQGMSEDFVKLEVAENTSIRVIKSQISSWKKEDSDKTSDRTRKKSPTAKKIKT